LCAPSSVTADQIATKVWKKVFFVAAWTGTLTTKFRKKTAGYTDKRVKIMSEILAGIETIKIQVWEKPFQVFVSKLRRCISRI
jgi:ABC transporter transmembrane region